MMQLLIGMLLGAMVSTPTGRSIGNQIGDAALKKVKDAVQASAAGEAADDGKSARAAQGLYPQA